MRLTAGQRARRAIQRPALARSSLTSSHDGGGTWSTPVQIGHVDEPSGAPPPADIQIRVDVSEIYVSGPGIFESNDAGQTWVQSYSAPIRDLEAIGGTAWAVGGCSSSDPISQCTLLETTSGSSPWGPAPQQPDFGSMAQASAASIELDRTTAQDAYLLVGGSEGGALFVTHDGGSDWTRRSSPCTTLPGVGLQNASGTTWVLCGGEGGAGIGPKLVYVSNDEGQSWELRASDLGSSPAGTIAASGYADSLALADSTTATIGTQRGGLLHTVDGGHTWSEVGSSGTCLGQGNGVNVLSFVSPSFGWAIEDNASGGAACPILVSTADGGATWQADGAPLGWSAVQGP